MRVPVLVSGTDGQKQVTYKFPDLIPGVDAFLKIEDIKNGAILVHIDDSTPGYYDTWQPTIEARNLWHFLYKMDY